MQFERWINADIKKGHPGSIDLGPVLFEGDNCGMRLGIRLFDGGEPVTVTGTVSAWAIVSTGQTISPIEDVGKDGNTAWVDVPQAALIPGRAEYFLRVTDGDKYAVALDVYATVKRTQTGETVVPGSPLPNVDQMRQLLAACESAGAAAIHAVRYDTAQNLTEAEKEQVRENIGASSGGGGSDNAHFPGTNFRVDVNNENFGNARYATAEGTNTTASGNASHAEGVSTVASGQSSHAEGFSTEATSQCSHAEGYMTYATNAGSHAEGFGSVADGHSSHAEGGSTASGASSHAEGDNTYATHRAQHVFGAYNVADPSTATSDERGTYVEIVGNGPNGDERSNARTLDWNGNEALAGSLTLGKGTANEVTITAAQLRQLLALLS